MKIELEINGEVVKKEYIPESLFENTKIKFAEAGMDLCGDAEWKTFIFRGSKMNEVFKKCFNLEHAWELRQMGWSYSAIARQYQVSHSFVSDRLKNRDIYETENNI